MAGLLSLRRPWSSSRRQSALPRPFAHAVKPGMEGAAAHVAQRLGQRHQARTHVIAVTLLDDQSGDSMQLVPSMGRVPGAELPPPGRCAHALACSDAWCSPVCRTLLAWAPPGRGCELLHSPVRLLRDCQEPGGAQLPPNVAWTPVAELPRFHEQLLRVANAPRNLRQGAFALDLTRSVLQ